MTIEAFAVPGKMRVATGVAVAALLAALIGMLVLAGVNQFTQISKDFNTWVHAVGTLGGEMFNEFFEKYAFRLQMEHGSTAHTVVSGACRVLALENYCRQQVKC